MRTINYAEQIMATPEAAAQPQEDKRRQNLIDQMMRIPPQDLIELLIEARDSDEFKALPGHNNFVKAVDTFLRTVATASSTS